MSFILGFLAAGLALIIFEALKTRRAIWQYGTCNNLHARRNKVSGVVEFVLWRAGEHGHMVEYWHKFDSTWYDQFEPYDLSFINSASRH